MKKILFAGQAPTPKTVAEMMNTLSSQKYNCFMKTASQLKNADYDEYDLLIAMEQTALQGMYHICGGDFAEKMFLLAELIDLQKDSIKA